MDLKSVIFKNPAMQSIEYRKPYNLTNHRRKLRGEGGQKETEKGYQAKSLKFSFFQV